MREELKAELDLLFKKRNKRGLERRIDPRLRDFDAHLQVLADFAAVRDRVIRPVMEQFGRYLESLGHRYFIEVSQELLDEHRYPTGRIAFHVLLNANLVNAPQRYPSFHFRTDEKNSVYAVRKTSQATQPVERYDLEGVTTELVEQNIKQFLIETVL